jgi:dethiobiotin synthetase
LTPDALNADLACALGFPVLLVVANRLGCLNQCRLTLEAIQHHGLTVAGVILNDVLPEADPDNAEDVQSMLPPSAFFAHLPHQPTR